MTDAPPPLRSIAVFCGSRAGDDPGYASTARAVGARLAQRGIHVVYGGGGTGLMGAVADGALAAGGEVTGVMPQALVDAEAAHAGLTRLHVVRSMHERKAMMAELAGGFVALPGGAGTLEEIAEQWTWAMLGVHGKPVGFLDVAGYWEPMHALVERMLSAKFLSREHAEMIAFAADLDDLLDRFQAYRPPTAKWSDRPVPPL